MEIELQLIAAPTASQPGGYVPVAYRDVITPHVASAQLGVSRQGENYQISLSWNCTTPIRSIQGNPRVFVDAAAILAPTVKDGSWATMGAKGAPLEGALWRADRAELYRIRSEGLGTVERSAAGDWRCGAEFGNGRWQLVFQIPTWPALTQTQQLGIAIWAGAEAERAGLKSISPGWVTISG